MKKLFVWLLVSVMLLASLPTFAEESLSQTAGQWNTEALEACAGYSESDDAWDVLAHETLAMQQYIAIDAQGGTLAGFYFSLHGIKNTGLLIPYLHVFYCGNALEPSAFSILADGIRYDFVGTAYAQTCGKRTLEMLSFPLDAQGIAVWRALAQCSSAQARLYGNKTYTWDVQLSGTRNTMEYIGSACLAGCNTLLQIADQYAGLSAYNLWDCNEAYLLRSGQSIPKMQMTSLTWATEEEIFAKDAMGVLSIGAEGRSVRALQEMLAEKGFFIGSADSNFRERAQQAVLLAQKTYGLLPTGFADRNLTNCLSGILPNAETPADNSGISYKSGALELCLRRYWFANVAEAGSVNSLLGMVTCDSADDILLILDGTAKNTSMESILGNAVSASIDLDGTAFSADITFEREQGTRFQNILRAMDETRFVLTAQIPKNLLEQAQTVSLMLTLKDGTKIIALR